MCFKVWKFNAPQTLSLKQYPRLKITQKWLHTYMHTRLLRLLFLLLNSLR